MKNIRSWKDFRFMLLMCFVFSLPGCALTDYASVFFSEMQDSNRYEEARSIDQQLCDPDILARLQKTRTKAWYDATVKDCQSRKETNIPLAN